MCVISKVVSKRVTDKPVILKPSISLFKSVKIPSAVGVSPVLNVAVLVVPPIFILTL